MGIENKILQELNRIEKTNRIKILYACESGSRAWGFSTIDSDYDVRFIYIHQPEWYLSIDERRDTIEQTISDQLDVSGWDIRKALKLFRKSNPSILEWLGSDVVYKESVGFTKKVKSLQPKVFSKKACLHHYFNMARKNYMQWKKGNKQDVKWYFNILRPLLYCKWIEVNHNFPPTKFQELMAILPSKELHLKVEELLILRKQNNAHKRIISQEKILGDFVENELDRIEDNLKAINECSTDITDQLDELFRETLRESWF